MTRDLQPRYPLPEQDIAWSPSVPLAAAPNLDNALCAPAHERAWRRVAVVVRRAG